MKAKHNTNSKKSLNKDIEGYLKSINFDERSEQGTLSDDELKKILYSNLKKYFEGKVTQDFILDLGSVIHQECPENDALLTVTCMMEDLDWKKPKSKKEIEKILRPALKILKKDPAKAE